MTEVRRRAGRVPALHLITSSARANRRAIVLFILRPHHSVPRALTEADTRGVVTANTESQLRTKTWAELAKWYRLCPLLTEFFTLTATTLAARDPAHAKTWRIDAVPWTENRVEAFAGLHNQGRRIRGRRMFVRFLHRLSPF
jgi:hypothetical protein